jgi:hypothetical protein
MTTKTIELTIEERRDLCSADEYCMYVLLNISITCPSTWHRYVWNTPADEQEYNELRDLRDKLKPVLIQKSGWVHKDHISEAHPPSIADYEYVTWEEFE